MTVTVRLIRSNVAVTSRAAVMDATQSGLPSGVTSMREQSPVQPLKDQFAAGAAVELDVRPVLIGRVAGAGVGRGAAQLMGPGVSVTEPCPSTCTVNARCTRVKVAVTLRAWLIVTTQVPVPAQPSPLHPVKLEFASGDADSVTTVPVR